MESFLLWPFHDLPRPVLALALGTLVAALSGWLTFLDLRACQVLPGRWPWVCGFAGGILAVALTYALLDVRCQETRDVVPTEFWRCYRLPYHLVLLTLLVSITATDLRTFYILDRTNYLGLLVGIGLATWSGDLQMEHIWVDWSWEEPQLRPPWTPAWLAAHPHWHGLAWSVTGAFAGALLTLLVQRVAEWVLGQPALGTGDVLLMAMIGSFLGWQPTLLAFVIAPILAVGWGLLGALLGGRIIIPYGPFLAAGAVIVMFSWKWILMSELSLTGQVTQDTRQVFALRRFLGDPYLLPLVLGGGFFLMILLLGGLRWYRSGDVKPEGT